MNRRFIKNNLAVLMAVDICLIAFLLLAFFTREGVFSGVDYGILMTVRTYASPFFDQITPFLTDLGDVVAVAATTLLLAVLFLLKKRPTIAALFVLGVGGGAAINVVIKQLVDRSRPDLWQHLVTETSHSFPSGHATASFALGLCIVLALWRTKWRVPAITFSASYIIMVALTRLYAGVHYPTDIVAAWLITAAWIGTVCVALRYYNVYSSEKHLT